MRQPQRAAAGRPRSPAKQDRGQALVIAALVIGMAAGLVTTILSVQERLLDGVRDARAGEAAVAAAGTAVADLLVARALELGRELDGPETEAFVAGPDVIDAARAAAVRLARAHGRADPSEVAVRAFGLEIEVHLVLAGRRHVALLEPPP